jgi:hypothetical protein
LCNALVTPFGIEAIGFSSIVASYLHRQFTHAGQAKTRLDEDERNTVVIADGNQSKASQGICDLQTPL